MSNTIKLPFIKISSPLQFFVVYITIILILHLRPLLMKQAFNLNKTCPKA